MVFWRLDGKDVFEVSELAFEREVLVVEVLQF